MQNKRLGQILSVAFLLSLFVVMLGAYTRLTDAGLGCPDWPGCYGHLVLPSAEQALSKAQNTFPKIPIESQKAWTEMVHRYAAGTLALLIFGVCLSLLRQKIKGARVPWQLPLFLIFLVLFQAALGMWTVTLKLLPVVVMGHLLGGMCIVAALSRLRLQLSAFKGRDLMGWRWALRIALVIVFVQIALGGWVSSNYAGISCIGFPTCNGLWIPKLHLAQGLNLFSPVGANYQGGVLEHDVRVTIQWIHRLGAFITALYLITLSFVLLAKASFKPLKIAAIGILILVCTQLILGVLNVLYLLPLPVAVAHNGVAALLLAMIFSALYLTRGENNDR